MKMVAKLRKLGNSFILDRNNVCEKDFWRLQYFIYHFDVISYLTTQDMYMLLLYRHWCAVFSLTLQLSLLVGYFLYYHMFLLPGAEFEQRNTAKMASPYSRIASSISKKNIHICCMYSFADNVSKF